MKIRTNNHWRDFVYRYDVPKKVLEDDLDWTDEDMSDGYFCYQNVWYHASQFIFIDFDGWEGVHNNSMTTGVLIKLHNDCERYKIASYQG